MWTQPRPSQSRTPRPSAMSSRTTDVISVTTPLQPPVTSSGRGSGGRGAAGGGGNGRKKSNSGGGGGGGGCFCCCGGKSRPRNAMDDGRRDKNKRRKSRNPETSDRSYTLAATDSASGITGLSQISDIPRYDSDSEMNTAHPTTVPSTSPSDHSTTTTIFNTNNNNNNNDNNINNNNDPKPSGRCGSCGRYVRKFFRVFFSLLGLTILVTGYAVGGGFLFAYLESEHEMLIREDVVKKRERAVEIMWNTTEQLNILHEEEWKQKADEILGQFQHEMHVLIHRGWDGAEAGEHPTSWTLGSSLLYSITVITTIGYGNVTPKTLLGRYSTIGYAIVGIPLCLMWLATMGGVMASAFRFLYKKISHLCLCLACKAPFCRRRGQQGKRRNKETDEAILAEGGEDGHRSRKGGGRREKKEGELKRVRVPIFVSLLIMVLYIVLGAVLFSMWENWEFSVAAYFCFVTLSTIGFGDYVPGFGTDMSQGKAIGNAFYLILGLALLAMCFDLMQEEVTLTFRAIAQTFSSWTSDNPDRSSIPAARTRKRDSGRGIQDSGRSSGKPLLKEENVERLTFRKPFTVSVPQTSSKSLQALVDVGREEDSLPRTLVRSRPYTVSASTTRYGPMPQTSLESHSTRTLPRTISSSSSGNNNNNTNTNNNSHNTKNSGEGGSWEPPCQPVPRSMSVPPQVLADTVDLLEHMSLSRRSSSPGSAKVQRRHRSRSPVRSRPKSRGPGNEDRGGNVDVATEEEEEDDDDDDDTLYAESMASSTDLVKVAHALRRERQQQEQELPLPPPPEPTVSPTPTLTSDDTAPLPAFTHPYNNSSMTTFRPSPPGGVGGGGGGGGGSATPGPQTASAFLLTPTPSRAASRCPSRARTSSTGSRSAAYYQGCELLSTSPSSSAAPPPPPSSSSSSSGVVDREVEGGIYEREECVDCPADLGILPPSAFSKPRAPSSVGSRYSDVQDGYGYSQPQPPQQHWQQPQQQQQQQQHFRQQQRQQQQQWQQQQQQQKQQQKQTNKVHSIDIGIMPPRCVSPRPRAPKTPQHKVAPPIASSGVNSPEHKRQPPPTLPKTKKMPVVAQAL